MERSHYRIPTRVITIMVIVFAASLLYAGGEALDRAAASTERMRLYSESLAPADRPQVWDPQYHGPAPKPAR